MFEFLNNTSYFFSLKSNKLRMIWQKRIHQAVYQKGVRKKRAPMSLHRCLTGEQRSATKGSRHQRWGFTNFLLGMYSSNYGDWRERDWGRTRVVAQWRNSNQKEPYRRMEWTMLRYSSLPSAGSRWMPAEWFQASLPWRLNLSERPLESVAT